MSNISPQNHPLRLDQKIVDFLQRKELYKEHIIDDVINGYSQDAILNAITVLSIADVVIFSNNNPMNFPAFVNAGEAPQPATINYPVFANLIKK